MKGWLLIAALGLAAAPSGAAAHQKSVSYSKWTILDAGALAQVKVSWLDLTSLPLAQDAAEAPLEPTTVFGYLQDHLLLETENGPCEPIEASGALLPAERGWMRVEWRVRCDAPPTALYSGLFRTLTNHVHLATIFGATSRDVVLSSTSPKARIASGEGARETGITEYLRLGVEHILTGWDHLAFLFLLIVIARRLREVVVLVTGFTVGHSITLAAAALGAVVPHPRAVEAIIAASILVIALENAGAEHTRGGRVVIFAAVTLFVASAWAGGLSALWGLALFTACYFGLLRTFAVAGRLRWVIACLFGFVHGLGFSSVLLEQELPRAELVGALFGFNVGVELGQLAIVAALWPLLQWLRRRDLGEVVVDVTSFAGAAVGTFALVVRTFG
ncbi:MAG: HupE/UreJ family protein [Myxococcales bacterium]|nr:HupE/UreJ family protein [Myxococcales bacterium]